MTAGTSCTSRLPEKDRPKSAVSRPSVRPEIRSKSRCTIGVCAGDIHAAEEARGALIISRAWLALPVVADFGAAMFKCCSNCLADIPRLLGLGAKSSWFALTVVLAVGSEPSRVRGDRMLVRPPVGIDRVDILHARPVDADCTTRNEDKLSARASRAAQCDAPLFWHTSVMHSFQSPEHGAPSGFLKTHVPDAQYAHLLPLPIPELAVCDASGVVQSQLPPS